MSNSCLNDVDKKCTFCSTCVVCRRERSVKQERNISMTKETGDCDRKLEY